MSDNQKTVTSDVVLIGAGIMSATLAALLTLVEPDWSITVVERLDGAAAESTDPWNNAGTGHSALCELNYTPARADGSIDISKAVMVNEQFQVSRQFWTSAVERGILTDVRGFVNAIPHVSFVAGEDKVDYLRRRREALVRNPLFANTEFIDDADEFARRLPYMAADRDFSTPVALNWSAEGTDVNFGSLAKQYLAFATSKGTTTLFGHEVRNLSRASDGGWTLKVRNNRTGKGRTLAARFVFVGAGGDALPLLQRAGISEANGFGGFPVGGKFIRTDNAELAADHRAKVYGFPPLGAPPMSAPHLDARIINDKSYLLFGPFAGWSPKFLKQGRYSDLLRSVKPNNTKSMITVGLSQFPLVKYLLGQLALTDLDRIDALRAFAPGATGADWHTIHAGQRVQVIRPVDGKGSLEFGTTVVGAKDGSIAGLLGASPGASTAVPAMLEVLESCFADRWGRWQSTLEDLIPSLGTKLSDEPELFAKVWAHGTEVLGLGGPPALGAAAREAADHETAAVTA